MLQSLTSNHAMGSQGNMHDKDDAEVTDVIPMLAHAKLWEQDKAQLLAEHTLQVLLPSKKPAMEAQDSGKQAAKESEQAQTRIDESV